MQTAFDCPCGERVSAKGEWADDKEADLVEICDACGRQFILTYTTWDNGSAAVREVPSSGGTSESDASDATDSDSSRPLEVGETAPDFELPGVDDDGIDTFSLSEYTESGPVLLSFYPFDFSPVCTSQLCRFRDIEWVRVAEDTHVFAISGDSTYSHRAFRRANDFQFPLLTDRLASVAASFGVRYDEWENQPAVCQRAIFGINPDRTIGYRWHTDDANEEPDFDDLEATLDWAE
jgi:peroxiredoxin